MRLGILCGGGPAPGMNSVISAATIEARNSGWDVLGIMDGFEHLIDGRTGEVRRYPLRTCPGSAPKGGSIIRTSRANPAVRDEAAADPDWRLHACLAALRKPGHAGGRRDEHGHVRLAELELDRLLARQAKGRFRARGRSVTVEGKNIGHELRCASPIPFDIEYTRDLGYAAVDYLSSYRVAREYMIRLDREDFSDPGRRGSIAAGAGLIPDAFRDRYGYLVQDQGGSRRLIRVSGRHLVGACRTVTLRRVAHTCAGTGGVTDGSIWASGLLRRRRLNANAEVIRDRPANAKLKSAAM